MTHLFNLAKLLDYYHYHVYDYYAVAKKKNASRSEHKISVVSIRRQCKQVVIPLKTSVSLPLPAYLTLESLLLLLKTI